MNPYIQFRQSVKNTLVAFTLLASTSSLVAENISHDIDDFSDPKVNSLGIERQYINDTTAGGKTEASHSVKAGVLFASGDIVPPRGQPGWASTVLLLNPQGQAVDASEFEGIRLRVRVNKGNLSLSANSSEITNFDYHAAMITPLKDGEFHEIRIPFSTMKRTWSEQTPLNPKTITGLSLVCFDVQKSEFEFEVDEVSFY